MHLAMAGINHQPLHIRLLYQALLKVSPNALVTPAAEAAVGILPIAIIRWQISPRGPGAQNPENSVNKQSVIFCHPPPIPLFAEQMRGKELPYMVRDIVAAMRWSGHVVKEYGGNRVAIVLESIHL